MRFLGQGQANHENLSSCRQMTPQASSWPLSSYFTILLNIERIENDRGAPYLHTFYQFIYNEDKIKHSRE